MAEENETAEETSEEPEGGGSKKIIIIAGIAIVALLGGAGAFFMMGSGGGDEEDVEIESSASVEEEASEESASEESASEESANGAEGSGESDEQSEDEDGSAKSGEKINFGETFPLKAFHINLGNPLENRYIRVEIALEYRNGSTQLKELEVRTPQIRDAVISVVSRKTREFLLGPDGKDQLRLEILNRVNQYLDRKIEAVYIMDMLVE